MSLYHWLEDLSLARVGPDVLLAEWSHRSRLPPTPHDEMSVQVVKVLTRFSLFVSSKSQNKDY